MIEIKNISKSYIKGDKIIDNMNLEIKDGEIMGFLGPNGPAPAPPVPGSCRSRCR